MICEAWLNLRTRRPGVFVGLNFIFDKPSLKFRRKFGLTEFDLRFKLQTRRTFILAKFTPGITLTAMMPSADELDTRAADLNLRPFRASGAKRTAGDRLCKFK